MTTDEAEAKQRVVSQVIQREDLRKAMETRIPRKAGGIAPHARRGAEMRQKPKSHKRLGRPLEVSVLLRAHTHDP